MPKKKKQESQITAIVCADTNYGIGYNNGLLINIPEDLKHFSRITSGGTVIMGRKTYESLPNAPLPKRHNIVITRNNPTGSPDEPIEKAPTYVSMDSIKEWLLRKREEKTEEKISVIGGSQIYSELLPYCDYIQITKVFKAFENVDTYFPNLDFTQDWELVGASDIMEYDGLKYQYRKYKNLKPFKPEKPKLEKKPRKKKSEKIEE
jgi:dihydrofolate reductase